MIPTSRVRNSFTKEEREAILREYRRSGLSHKDFAAGAGIGVSTLCLWLRKQRDGSAEAGATPTFVAAPNLFPPPSAGRVYRLECRRGFALEFGRGFDPAELAALLKTVEGL